MFCPSRLIWLSVCFFFTTLYITAPTIAAYSHTLNFPAWLIGLTVGAYGGAMVLFRIPLVLFASVVGAKRLILMGLTSIILGLSLPFLPFWPFLFLPVSRFLLGVGASVYVLYTVLYLSHFPKSELSKSTSRITFAYAFPQIFAAWLGGSSSEKFGWLAPFALGIPAALAAIALIIPLKEDARGQQWTGKRELWKALTTRLFICSAIAMIGFFVAMATFYSFSQILGVRLEATKQELGWMLFAMIVPFTSFLLLASRVQNHFGVPKTIILGMFLLGLGVILMPNSRNLAMLMGLQALGGMGFGLVFPTTMSESIRGVEERMKYWVMGVYQTVYALGIALGPTVAGMIAERLGLAWVFWIMGLISFSSIGLVWFVVTPEQAPVLAEAKDASATT